MKFGRTLAELAAELDRQNSSKKDFVADTREMKFLHSSGGCLHLNSLGEVFPLTQHTHRQIGERISIPAKYYDRMRQEAPALLAQNVNHWFQQTPERRMLRTLDGSARAFLSDRYHRIDNYAVAQTALPVLAEIPGLKVESADITENKMYLKAVTDRIQGEVRKGDVVQAGLVISNSEIGLGAVKVEPMLYRLVCLNGMITAQAFRKYHVGSQVTEDGELGDIFSDETLQADDHALLLKIRDICRAAVDLKIFNENLERLREAATKEIKARPVKAIEVLSNKMNLPVGDRDNILEFLLRGGDMTQYGMANAVTAYSQKVESYDRATELEAVGGRIIVMNKTDWREVAEAA